MPRSSGRKRMPHGMGSIRKRTTERKDGSVHEFWEGRVAHGYHPDTGKQKVITVSGNTQREVLEKLQRIAVEKCDGEYVDPSKRTVGEWLDVWLKEYQGSKKPLTVDGYRKVIEKHIRPALGDKKLQALTNLMVQRFYNQLSFGDKPLAPKTVKNIHGVLHKALQQAVKAGELKRNPADECVLPKLVKPEIKPLEPEEITRFVQNLEGEPYKNLFLTAFFTGMRQGELLGLSWDRVDFDNGIIEICQQLQCLDGKYFLETPKHDKTRIIAPAQIVMDALREEQKSQQAWKDRIGEGWSNEWNLVFTDGLGKHLVRRTVDKHFKKILEKSGIEPHCFHDMRHTFAVSMLDAGEDVKSLQMNLGHSSAAFTLNQYAHVSQKMRMQSSKRMNDYFSNLMPQAAPSV